MDVNRVSIGLCVLCIFSFVVTAPADEKEKLRDFVRKGYLLNETEVARIKEEIRTRCHLREADEATYPWYYHYELGLAMKKRNDWQRALDSFLVALDEREIPQKSTRIYGMWFLDYYPYYNIGLAHYHLQNWKCAADSFRLSQIFEDMPAGSFERLRMQEYEAQAEQNASD